MNEEQLSIWTYLDQNARGFSQRKSSTEIKDACNLEAGDSTNVYVRNLITDMILNHRCCIGSQMWKHGYWIVQNEEELTPACESLENRAASILERTNVLRQNWEHSNG